MRRRPLDSHRHRGRSATRHPHVARPLPGARALEPQCRRWGRTPASPGVAPGPIQVVGLELHLTQLLLFRAARVIRAQAGWGVLFGSLAHLASRGRPTEPLLSFRGLARRLVWLFRMLASALEMTALSLLALTLVEYPASRRPPLSCPPTPLGPAERAAIAVDLGGIGSRKPSPTRLSVGPEIDRVGRGAGAHTLLDERAPTARPPAGVSARAPLCLLVQPHVSFRSAPLGRRFCPRPLQCRSLLLRRRGVASARISHAAALPARTHSPRRDGFKRPAWRRLGPRRCVRTCPPSRGVKMCAANAAEIPNLGRVRESWGVGFQPTGAGPKTLETAKDMLTGERRLGRGHTGQDGPRCV